MTKKFSHASTFFLYTRNVLENVQCTALSLTEAEEGLRVITCSFVGKDGSRLIIFAVFCMKLTTWPLYLYWHSLTRLKSMKMYTCAMSIFSTMKKWGRWEDTAPGSMLLSMLNLATVSLLVFFWSVWQHWYLSMPLMVCMLISKSISLQTPQAYRSNWLSF